MSTLKCGLQLVNKGIFCSISYGSPHCVQMHKNQLRYVVASLFSATARVLEIVIALILQLQICNFSAYVRYCIVFEHIYNAFLQQCRSIKPTEVLFSVISS